MRDQRMYELRKRMNISMDLRLYIQDAELIENNLSLARERIGEDFKFQCSSEYLIIKAHTLVDREIVSVEVGVTPEHYGPLYCVLKDRILEVEEMLGVKQNR